MGRRFAWTAAAGVVAGLWLGWRLWSPRPLVVEPPAVSVRQADSSLLLARRPDTVVRILHRIPPGYIPERSLVLGIQPAPRIDTLWRDQPGATATPREILRVDTLRPPVVRVALTLARLGDGSRRVIASSPDGTVVDSLSIDVPLGPAAQLPRALRYSAGVTRDAFTGAWGGVLTRDVGPFRLAAIGEPAQAGRPAQFKLGVGLRF